MNKEDVSALQAGHYAAWEGFYGPPMNLMRRIARKKGVPDDVDQEGYLRAYKGIGQSALMGIARCLER